MIDLHSVSHLVKAYFPRGFKDSDFLRDSKYIEHILCDGYSPREIAYKIYTSLMMSSGRVSRDNVRLIIHPSLFYNMAQSRYFERTRLEHWQIDGIRVETDPCITPGTVYGIGIDRDRGSYRLECSSIIELGMEFDRYKPEGSYAYEDRNTESEIMPNMER
jgi:hypothetical protein